MYGFQSYISVPILRPAGAFFGTLCAIDPRPARVNTPETIGMFRLFAELIGLHLDLHERLTTSEASLSSERQGADLRDQFIAVLGHDLRNPLAAIDAGVKLLLRQPLDDKAASVLGLMQNSVARMSSLINNVLDFARGRLGGGMPLSRDATAALEPTLQQVVAELRAAWPDRVIETRFALTQPVDCDRARIGQLLSNLLGNALKHGAADGPIRVRATTDRGVFELSVSNSGDPIPSAMVERLFQPFVRAATRPGHQGLGLGLYIASEIARAHGGVLDVASTPAETRFTLRMPVS
jgi:signal transduction histidine kinase